MLNINWVPSVSAVLATGKHTGHEAAAEDTWSQVWSLGHAGKVLTQLPQSSPSCCTVLVENWPLHFSFLHTPRGRSVCWVHVIRTLISSSYYVSIRHSSYCRSWYCWSQRRGLTLDRGALHHLERKNQTRNWRPLQTRLTCSRVNEPSLSRSPLTR